MLVTAALILFAVLAYLGRSLVMLTSVGGIAVALWVTRAKPIHTQIAGAAVGAVAASLAAEVIHLVYHTTQAEPAEHGAFWMSAVLVGLINGAGIAPVIWLDDRWRRRREARRAAASP